MTTWTFSAGTSGWVLHDALGGDPPVWTAASVCGNYGYVAAPHIAISGDRYTAGYMISTGIHTMESFSVFLNIAGLSTGDAWPDEISVRTADDLGDSYPSLWPHMGAGVATVTADGCQSLKWTETLVDKYIRVEWTISGPTAPECKIYTMSAGISAYQASQGGIPGSVLVA